MIKMVKIKEEASTLFLWISRIHCEINVYLYIYMRINLTSNGEKFSEEL